MDSDADDTLQVREGDEGEFLMLDLEVDKDKTEQKESRSTKVRPSQYSNRNDPGIPSINDSQYLLDT